MSIIPFKTSRNKASYLGYALKYAKLGYSIIPIKPKDKSPLVEWTQYQKERATEEQIRSWWLRWPNANIGVVTGRGSGIVVLDVDGPEGEQTIKDRGYSLPPTTTSRTGGGGWHYLFRWPGFECSNFAGEAGRNIDFRGDGGYIVAPPSEHKNGNCYEWAPGLTPGDIAPTELPLWLSELLKRPREERTDRVDPLRVLAGVPEGVRDKKLFEYACRLRAQGARKEEALVLILTAAANCSPPFPEEEARMKVAQAWKYDGPKEEEPAWPSPEPIKPSLRPVENLHHSIIPGPLREWLLDISYRMQCPVDFVAVGALVTVGSLIGAGCGIRPKQRDDWTVIPNLWGGVVARPSMLKSPALSEVLQPLKKLEAKALDDFEDMRLFAEVEEEIAEEKRKEIRQRIGQAVRNKKDDRGTMDALRAEYMALADQEPPTRRRYLTNDATIEKMAELLNENQRGLLYFRDELVGFLVNLDREDRQADRAFYLESWNGFGSYTTDRIGRGTIDTDNLCVSILGGIQPSRLTGYLLQAKDDLQNDGLLQRFQLLVYPDEPSNWKLVDEYPNKEARKRAYSVFSKLANMDFQQYGAMQPYDEGRPYFHFSEEAQEIFFSWLIDLQERLKTEDVPLMVEHLSKYRSLLPSLALIFHLINIANGQAEGPVSDDATLAAISWCDYLENHARRIYGMVGDIGQRAAGELAKRIKEGKVKDSFTSRDVYRNCWQLLDKENTELACKELEAAGWLIKNRQTTGGRPKEVYSINPIVLDENA